MELKWLKTFVTTVETGNFRVAAEKLFISQPSITVHIKQLETFLDVLLFERNHTKIHLTTEGKQFYHSALLILQMVDESKREIQLLGEAKKIPIIIILSPLIVETNIPSILSQFLAMYPQYEMEILVEDSLVIEDFMKGHHLQLAISLEKHKNSFLHAEKIGSSTMHFIYPKNYQLDERVTHFQLPKLIEKFPLFTGHLPEASEIDTQLKTIYPSIHTMKITQSHIIKQFVKDGLGMAFLPKFLVTNEVNLQQVNHLHIDLFLLPMIDIYMNYTKENEQLLPLLQMIREQFKLN